MNGGGGCRDDGEPTTRSDAAQDHLGRTLRTLEQCALHKRTLRLDCPRCGHVRVLDAVCLWYMFNRRGWSDDLPSAARRLLCTVCRDRGTVTRPRVTIGRDAPTGEPLPYPDQSTWRRLVSRYRS